MKKSLLTLITIAVLLTGLYVGHKYATQPSPKLTVIGQIGENAPVGAGISVGTTTATTVPAEKVTIKDNTVYNFHFTVGDRTYDFARYGNDKKEALLSIESDLQSIIKEIQSSK